MAPRAAWLLALALALAAPTRGGALTWKTCGAGTRMTHSRWT
jgi:hypothetical protein